MKLPSGGNSGVAQGLWSLLECLHFQTSLRRSRRRLKQSSLCINISRNTCAMTDNLTLRKRRGNPLIYRLNNFKSPLSLTLSWICSTLTEFRQSCYATEGSICSLSGLISFRPSANPLSHGEGTILYPLAGGATQPLFPLPWGRAEFSTSLRVVRIRERVKR